MSHRLHTILPRLWPVLMMVLLAGCQRGPEKPLTPEDVMNQPDARMRSIILTRVELLNVPVDEAVRYLAEQAHQADPDKKGVTILYRSFNLNMLPPRVSLQLPQATVLQVLEEICRQSRSNYMINKDTVTVLPESMFKSSGAPGPFYNH